MRVLENRAEGAGANWATAFVIPMAISLAFGVLFATLITLFLVPSLYLVLEDFYAALRRLSALGFHRFGIGDPPEREAGE